MIKLADLIRLTDRWGAGRTEDILVVIAKATDHKGLPILIDPTYEHVDMILTAIYAPEALTLAELEFSILGGFTRVHR